MIIRGRLALRTGLGVSRRHRLSSTSFGTPPVNSVAPVISATTWQVGVVASCTTGTWTNTPTLYAYQWYRGATLISGAVNSTYTIAVADVGSTLICEVDATNVSGTGSVNSNTSPAIIPNVPTNTVLPVTTPADIWVGSVLTTDNGTWTNTPTGYTYQWYRDGSLISGATAATYTLVVSDITHSITCRVVASNAGGAGTFAESVGRRCLWSPIAFGANLYRWVNVDVPGGVTEAAGTITQINDLSGNGRHYVQATQSSQPVKQTSALFAGKNVARFSGVATTGPYMQGVGTLSYSGPIYCAMVAFRMAMIANSGRVTTVAQTTLADNTTGAIQVASQGGTANLLRGQFGGANVPNPNYSYDGSTPMFWCSKQNASGAQISAFGAAFVSEVSPQARTITPARAALGANLAAGNVVGPNRMDGEFYEEVAFAGFEPVQADIDRWFGYVAYRTGNQALLPAGHPYKSSPP